jgi:hypothetical protein
VLCFGITSMQVTCWSPAVLPWSSQQGPG